MLTPNVFYVNEYRNDTGWYVGAKYETKEKAYEYAEWLIGMAKKGSESWAAKVMAVGLQPQAVEMLPFQTHANQIMWERDR